MVQEVFHNFFPSTGAMSTHERPAVLIPPKSHTHDIPQTFTSRTQPYGMPHSMKPKTYQH